MLLKKSNASCLLITKILVFFVISATLLSGCGQGKKEESEPQRASTQQQQQSEKIPDQLKSIEENVEKIFKALGGPSVELKEEQDKEKGKEQQSEEQSQGGQEAQGNEQQENEGQEGSQKEGQEGQEGQGGQGGQSEQGQKDQQKQQKQQPQDPWQKIVPIANDLHYKWNAYMPEAVKKGADKKLIDSFGTALNSLTNTIIAKNKTNTLMAASFLYAYIPDFYSLYKTNTSPEVKRIRHYIRNSMLNAMTANWTQSDADINNLKSSWTLFKNVIEKDQQDFSNKLDFSIYELDKAIKERNQPIIDIKGRIAISNIEELEKAMEKASENVGQNESS